MARRAEAEKAGVYAAAQQWVDAALRSDDSLFTPGKAVWTLETLDDLHYRFSAPDEGTGGFWHRLEQQLADAPSKTVQLAAEAFYIRLLIDNARLKATTKREQIRHILSWADTNITLPDYISQVLGTGICDPGTAFNMRVHHNLQLIVHLSRTLKQDPQAPRDELLTDPWVFQNTLIGITTSASYNQASALLHLVHPDTFERIVSRDHKDRIVSAFADHLDKKSTDRDRNLLAIRQQLSETYGKHLDFYDDQLWPQWDSRRKQRVWDQFIHWARRFVEHPDFDKEERDYKLDIAQSLLMARSAVEAEAGDWLHSLRDVFNMKSNNLTSWRAHGDFIEWCRDHPTDAIAAMRELWSEDYGMNEAVRSFSNLFPRETLGGTGTRTRLISFLMMAIDAYKYPRYMYSEFRAGYSLTGYPLPDSNADEAETYRHALGYLDTFISEASQRDLELRDPLDAQSALWAVVRSSWYDEFFAEDEREAFLAYRAQGPPVDDDEDGDPAQTGLENLARRLRWDTSHLQEIERLLEDKRQVVFYGPPGTGKTYVAQELAEYFAGEHGSLDLVQFHPSYAYEDFIEGFRPALVDDQPGFKLKDGPLKRIADRARSEPNAKHVLVIDEINRGNLAKVFGELYFLLEYRDREISLQYADQPFTLPENLWIIATMNTADRSIALVDAALRRRFYFVPFFPDEPPVEGLLRRWLLEEKPTMLWVADVVEAANQILKDLDKRDMAVGPSYFMNKKLDEEWVRRIWKHSILPYVEEQLFGQTDRIGEFELDNLRAVVQRSAGAEEEAATANGQADAAPEPGDA